MEQYLAHLNAVTTQGIQQEEEEEEKEEEEEEEEEEQQLEGKKCDNCK